MGFRGNPRGASKDPHQGPWATCDRCGFIYSMSRMQFQYDFVGGPEPQDLHLLVCNKCLDDLNFQQKFFVLPGDPQPFMNTRPEQYVADESSWLTTENGDVLVVGPDQPLTTNIPNPADTPVPAGDLSTAEAAVPLATQDGDAVLVTQDGGSTINLQPNPADPSNSPAR